MATKQDESTTNGLNQAPPPYMPGYDASNPNPTHYGYNQQGDVTMLVPAPVDVVRFAEPMPSNTGALIVSIISIFFCLCFGIPATVIAAKAKESGNPEVAKKKISTAMSLAIAGIVIGIVITGINVALRLTVYSQNNNNYNG